MTPAIMKSARKKRTITTISTREDRLSSLPDDIIGNILPLLPIKNAVATSALSRRWNGVWTHMNYCNIIPAAGRVEYKHFTAYSKCKTNKASIRATNGDIEPLFRQLHDWHFQDIHIVNNYERPSVLRLPKETCYIRSLKLENVEVRARLDKTFPNLTHIGLQWRHSDASHGVGKLLEASPALETLVLKFGRFCGLSTQKSGLIAPCDLKHLKNVEIEIEKPICFGEINEDGFDFFKSILTGAPLLERIILKYTSQEFQEFLMRRSLPYKFQYVEIGIHLGNFPEYTNTRLGWRKSDNCKDADDELLDASPAPETLVLKCGEFRSLCTAKSGIASWNLKHLKIAELMIEEPIRFDETEDLLNLLEIILSGAPLLERIIFRYTSPLSKMGKKERLFHKELQELPRRSLQCQIKYYAKYTTCNGCKRDWAALNNVPLR